MPITPVQIDLRNITDEIVAEALPNAGGRCDYTAPCIIGALVPSDCRAFLEDAPFGDTMVGTLIDKGYLALPKGQEWLARRLQLAFDVKQENGELFLAELEEVRAALAEQVSA